LTTRRFGYDDAMSPPALRPVRALSDLGGAALAGATRIAAALRPAAKPLHPRGRVVTGTLVRTGAGTRTGIEWVDVPGEDQVLARESRAVGLPRALPDIHGLALRIPSSTGYGDLLFASTGLGRLTRYVLTAARSAYARPMTTLLPYRSPVGPLLLAATPEGEGSYRLSVAVGRGAWQPFARLALDEEDAPDPTVSFDPLRHTLPGLENYGWVQRLREPAYRTARASRRE
jgi:hypothetical protein